MREKQTTMRERLNRERFYKKAGKNILERGRTHNKREREFNKERERERERKNKQKQKEHTKREK